MRLLIPAFLALLLTGAALPLSGCDDGTCSVKGDDAVPIGGDYTLTNQDGQTVSSDAFHGTYQLVYFGFTYCPDICPTELQTMSAALDKLGDGAKAFTPIFITVDPARDTPEALKEYLEHFHPGFVGLTGTAEQVAETAKAFKVYYAKRETGDDPEAYTMDHSSFIYVLDCQGRFIAHFDYGTTAEAIADKLETLL
jgi:protein SCO1/2